MPDSSPVATEPGHNNLKAEIFWLALLPLALLEWLLCAVLLPRLTAAPDLSQIKELFLAKVAHSCLPEPLEQRQYVLGVILFFFYSWFCAWAIPRWCSKFSPLISPPSGNLRRTITASVLTLQAALLVGASYGWLQNLEAAYYYGLILCLPLGFAWTWALKRRMPLNLPKSAGPWAIVLAAVFTLLGLWPGLFTEKNILHAYPIISYHLPFTMDEFAAVLNGRTPLVDYFPQYQNLLPFLMLPYFKLFGFSVGSFTVLMAVFSAICLGSIYLVLMRVTRNAVFATALYLPILAGSFFSMALEAKNDPRFLWERADSFSYFAFQPLRTLGPWSVCFLYLRYLELRSQTRIVLLFAVAALFAVNNLDLGLPAFATAVISVILTPAPPPAPESKERQNFLARSLRVVAMAAACFALAIAFFVAIAYARTGLFPELAKMVTFQKIFVEYGFNMLPLPKAGLYWVVFLSFGFSVAAGLFGLSQPEVCGDSDRRLRMGMLLFSGVMGFGATTYYVGRSHHNLLVACFPFWLFSNSLLLWELLRYRLRGKWHYTLLLPTVFCAFISSAFLARSFDYVAPQSQVKRLAIQDLSLSDLQGQIVTHLRAVNPDRLPLMVIYPYGHQLALQVGSANLFPFTNAESLILKAQVAQVLEVARLSGVQRIVGSFPPELGQAIQAAGFSLLTTLPVTDPALQELELKTVEFWAR